jgi:bifunctional UDP-N-acetylglucosamine pyrophosphorylase/glucosamine-1-phosphate N-acetyltransferase
MADVQSTGAKSRMAAVVLAAGKGTRMKSRLPKILHPVAGRSMVDWVLLSLQRAEIRQTCLVVGTQHQAFSEILADRPDIVVAVQHSQAGTGDAVASAAAAFAGAVVPSYSKGELVRGEPLDATHILVCTADTPALDPATLRRFVDESLKAGSDLAVLAMDVPDPTGYGRVIQDGAGRVRIVEHRDASESERSVTLSNTGIIFARRDVLFTVLAELKPNNSQKEYYLTDCFALGAARGLKTGVVVATEWQQFAGVNDRLQMADVEAKLVARRLAKFMQDGVTIRLPNTVFADDTVCVAPDTVIEPGVVLLGQTVVGTGCRIEAGARLLNARVADGAVIGAGSILGAVEVSPGQRILPLTVME